MGRSLEMRRKKNLDAFDEIDEMNWRGQTHTSGRSQEKLDSKKLDSIREIFESDWYKELEEETRKELEEETRGEDRTSSGILTQLGESMKPDEELRELWSASDLGKYTIGTPTQEKQSAQNEDRNMQPVSELEFQEISEDVDREDAEMQKKLMQLVEELEGIF